MVLIFASCGTIKNELGISGNPGLTYNKLSISESQLDSEMKALANNKPLADLLKDSGEPLVKNGVLAPTYRASWANIRMRTLAIQEARIKNKMKITAKDKKSALSDAKSLFAGQTDADTNEIWKAFPKSFQNDLIDSFAEQYALVRAAPKVSDEEIKKYFDANQDKLAPACDSGKTISHILVKTEKEAQDIKKQLDEGADFEKLAKEKSTDPGSKDSGGSLGCFIPGNFVEAFENVASSLPIGSVSDVVKTEFGYHILKATAYKAPTLEESKDQIKQTLEPDKQTKLYDQVQASLKKAKVTVLKKYGRVSKDDQGLPKIIPLKKDTPATTTTTTPQSDTPSSVETVPAT